MKIFSIVLSRSPPCTLKHKECLGECLPKLWGRASTISYASVCMCLNLSLESIYSIGCRWPIYDIFVWEIYQVSTLTFCWCCNDEFLVDSGWSKNWPVQRDSGHGRIVTEASFGSKWVYRRSQCILLHTLGHASANCQLPSPQKITYTN